jgi:predicted nuclease with RNAse H fold
MSPSIVGLDLAGSELRNTGYCLMDRSLRCETRVLHSDDEITTAVRASNPRVVSVDAPLFLPLGRKSLEIRGPPHFRECDLELRRMKIRFFPISLGPMRKLTERGIRLRKIFEDEGIEVIESFPGAIQDMLGMPRKQVGLEKLQSALLGYGVRGDIEHRDLNGDELDAITSAIVGKLYEEGDYLAIGDPREGLMILPKVAPS